MDPQYPLILIVHHSSNDEEKQITPSKRAVAAEGPPNSWTPCFINCLPPPYDSAQSSAVFDLHTHHAPKRAVADEGGIVTSLLSRTRHSSL
ncbi:hypothetical protein ACFX1Z_008017 [Malus domestica]